MIRIDLRGMADVQRMLRNLAEEQMPYAMMVTLNNTAFAVQKASKTLLTSAFDRPTPLIKGATRVIKATKQSLTSTTLIDPKRAVILETHELGGKRGDQKLERFLKSKGWLPSGHRAVPTDKMPLNSYGNPKAAEVNKIIAGLPSIGGIRGDKRRMFVIPSGGRSRLSPGIYRTLSKSKGAAITKLYHFVSTAQYRATLEWEVTMEREARAILPDEMQKAVQRAIETARG